MARFVRAAAALNAVFALGVGSLCVLSPTAAAGAFKVDVASVAMLGLIRMFGGLLAASGLVSALVAKDLERSPMLARVFAACLLLNVTADAVVISAGELRFDQLAVGMVLEAMAGVLLVVHELRRGPRV